MQKQIVDIYLKQVRRVWRRLPGSVKRSRAVRGFGHHVDGLVRNYSDRSQHFATFFMRNRPEMQMLRNLVNMSPRGSRLDVTILACSKGAEVYSMAYVIRTARPDLELHIHAVDISPEIVDFAERGVYSMRKSDDQDLSTEEAVQRKGDVASIPSSDKRAWIFERLSPDELDSMFEIRGGDAVVRPWLREGIDWQIGDAGDPAFAAKLGKQDIVVANRFLCHMVKRDAEKCLSNLDRFVKPGGFLFVSGVDVDVRCKVAITRGWNPLTELIREIHAADDLLDAWPLQYWALEPLDEERSDWKTRYASVFRVGTVSDGASVAPIR